MKRALLMAVTGAWLLLWLQPSTPMNAQATDGLKFFKNYFITGDYVVGGVGLRGQGVDGLATGVINMPDVPADADIVGAFLYWQVVTKDTIGPESGATGVMFNGYPLTGPDGPMGKVLDTQGTSPCWSSGGGTGSSGGVHRTYTYRMDVARFLNYDANTGKPIVGGPHSIAIPDGGNGIPIALGATLVAIYRDTTKPYSAIVLYDDGFTVDNSNRTMTQTIKGFYQPSATPDAKVTYIVGSGQANKNEVVSFQGTALDPSPFGAFLGDSWDNYTKAVSLKLNPQTDPTTLSQVSTTVSIQGVSGSDCLSPAAIVFKTNVLDTDGDGLLDKWESATTPLLDPQDQPLPLLSAMGAKWNHKDVFIEFGYMKNDGQDLDPLDPTAPRDDEGNVLPGKWVKYGSVWKPAHSHQPGHEAIKLFGDAFKNAPVSNPDGIPGIKVHIDAGVAYPFGDPLDPKKNGDAYIIRGTGYERGGEVVDENATVCQRGAGDPPWFCQFSDFPGTIGWKTGFRYIRDQVIGSNSTPPQDADTADPCDVPGNDGPGEACERRFDRNRRAMFRYTFFGHFLGLPKSDMPCLDDEGQPTDTNPETSLCDVAENPEFHIPMTVSGVGDFPGADHMVTLGGFNDITLKPVGTPFMQASTWAHEFGHTVFLRHGGGKAEPNCKPTYFSVMNYLYQLRGLLDNAGRPNLDFSRLNQPNFSESPLSDNPFGELSYRLGWYAPLAGSYLEEHGVAAARHCDGSPLLGTDVPMVRVDAAFTTTPIDWNADNSVDLNFALDVNFNGRTTTTVGGNTPELLAAYDDWSNILLNQVGVRRNVGGLYYDVQGNVRYGPMSIDTGRVDLGRVDLGRVDLGRVDLGRVDLGRVDLGDGQAGRVDLGRVDLGDGDLGAGDMGRVDLGRVDLGRVDLGRVDLGRVDLGRGDDGRGDSGGGDRFLNDANNPPGELDATTAGDLNRSAPTEFKACVIGVDADCAPISPLHAVSFGFSAPTSGAPLYYEVYRVEGPALVPNQEWTLVKKIDAVLGQETYADIDGTPLDNDAAYTYFSRAFYPDAVVSDPSNPVTIIARNDPATAGNDAYSTLEDTALVQPAPGVLGNDGDPDAPTPIALTAVLVTGPSHGTLSLSADGSFTYTPNANYNGADAFTYKATGAGVETNVATVNITVTPVNDLPTAGDDSYQTNEDTPLNIAAPGVLGNDSDVEGTVSAVLVSGPAQGSLTLNANGSFTYTPPANYNGAVSFTYRARDNDGADSNLATVSITVNAVNDVPLAGADSYSVLQGTPLVVAAPGVLGNDSDVEGPLSAVLQTGPSNGTLTLNANGSFTYTPTGTFYGTDSFTYRASDGVAASNTATVTITVRKLTYDFLNVQNLPPSGGKAFNVGSAIPLAWRFLVDGVAYNSVNAMPHIVIISPTGQVTYSGTPADPGSSSFQPPTAANGYTWQFNWQTKNLVAGTFQVYVGSDQTGQTYANGLAFGPFAIKLK